MRVPRHLYELVSPDAPRDVRLKIAAGDRGLSPVERLTALFILSHDRDEAIRQRARTTLLAMPLEELKACLGSGRLEPVVLKGLATIFAEREEVLALIASSKGITKELLRKVLSIGGKRLLERLQKVEPEPAEGGKERRVENLSTSEKIKLALRGNKEMRTRLIKDPNRMVALSVLKNPSITEDEVIKVTASRSVPEELLAEVAKNRQWLKNYRIRYNLVTNPKTPLHLALRLMGHLLDKDLKALARSKNIPSVLAMAARRMVEQKERG